MPIPMWSVMSKQIFELLDKLEEQHTLSLDEYRLLAQVPSDDERFYAAQKARRLADEAYGKTVYIRGLIEFSNICKNNCFYCGIRAGNHNCERYRLTEEEILDCCRIGYELGFRTFVLQGGEDLHFTDDVFCNIIQQIKIRYPECAITLSLGERSRESYQRLFDAGADRYLLRHETADLLHYQKLHPIQMSFDARMECLKSLKEIGYQVGCGFMVQSPFQTPDTIAADLKFIETFSPEMCGIGPFIPHQDTIFKDKPAGSLTMTLWLLSIIRLIHPDILLPATTALGTIHPKGRELGILAGANVVMPNLSPPSVREKYMLYNQKLCTGCEAAEHKKTLTETMLNIGYQVVTDRGDAKGHSQK